MFYWEKQIYKDLNSLALQNLGINSHWAIGSRVRRIKSAKQNWTIFPEPLVYKSSERPEGLDSYNSGFFHVQVAGCVDL